MSHVVFVVLAPFVLALLVGTGVVAWRRRPAPGAAALAAVAGAGAGWLLCSLGEAVAPSPGLSAVTGRLAYLAIPWVPVAWLAFALDLTGRGEWARTVLFRLVVAVAVVTSGLAAATALGVAPRGFLWTSFETVRAGAFYDTAVVYGPWFWVHAIVSWATAVTGSALILRAYARARRSYQRLSAWLVVGATVPLVVNALFVFRLIPVAKDFSPISFGLGAAALALGVLRYRLLDVQPTARSVLVESMGEALVVLDGDGRVTDFNPALERIAGPGLRLGEPLAEAAPALAAVASGAGGEVAVPGPDGPRHFEWRATPIGRPPRALGRLVLLRDVTARRDAEAALREALAEVHARNEELDAFAHTVAHDLKNPIHVVRGYAELLLEDGDALSADLRRESVETILRTADKMNVIVHELLLLSGVRAQAVTPVPLDMGGVVREALGRLGPFLHEHGAVVSAPEAWPRVVGYGPWIEEVWVNYLSNAVKYGGRPPRVALGFRPSGADVRFWVEDNGGGLSPEAQAQVFAPFTRLHEGAAEGHGLGLSIVRRVLDKLGGTYGVESAPGAGSRFYFTLPAAGDGGTPGGEAGGADAPPAGLLRAPAA